jgi:hypothetical protein
MDEAVQVSMCVLVHWAALTAVLQLCRLVLLMQTGQAAAGSNCDTNNLQLQANTLGTVGADPLT